MFKYVQFTHFGRPVKPGDAKCTKKGATSLRPGAFAVAPPPVS
jgi:hypothetical protein